MPHNYPTVLVAVEEAEMHNLLVQRLRRDGFLVLEATNSTDAVYIARTHSRPIQVILVHASMKDELTAAVRQYRPHTEILLVAEHGELQPQDVLTPEIALVKIREFFNL